MVMRTCGVPSGLVWSPKRGGPWSGGFGGVSARRVPAPAPAVGGAGAGGAGAGGGGGGGGGRFRRGRGRLVRDLGVVGLRPPVASRDRIGCVGGATTAVPPFFPVSHAPSALLPVRPAGAAAGAFGAAALEAGQCAVRPRRRLRRR
ncbi:MAG: hypothetical protein ACR2MO_10135, partial [Acidimicrobiales bacterium]